MNKYKTINKLEPVKIYTYKELLKTLSPQSSTAEYILMDLIVCGIVEKTVNGYRLNQ